MKVKDFLVPLLFIVIAIILIVLMLLLPKEPQVDTAIGVQNIYASGLSDETQELVDDLRWKHYGYVTLYSDSTITIDYTDYYQWTMYFEDGKLFMETLDGKWFIEMEKMKEE